jgi:nucleotide-binding universal stress UspA family protein
LRAHHGQTYFLANLEAVVFNHVLVPLDGSALAECVLPHVEAIAPVTNAHITVIHVLENSDNREGGLPIDPMGWHMQKQELQAYLEKTVARLRKAGLSAEHILLEGNAAESIIEFAHANAVDLIALSTHGRTGLSGWSVSSVVQKVLLRSYRSILLVRAYQADLGTEIHYKQVFIGSDCSARAEFILPVAISLAKHHQSQLILGTVIERPQIIQRFPLSEKDLKLIKQLAEKNQKLALHYHEQLATQFSLKGLDIKTSVVVADRAIGALHDMANEAGADLVMLVAHGDTGERRWPYGSIATSFIAHGNAPLMIMQDLSEQEILPTPAEQAIREVKGH